MVEIPNIELQEAKEVQNLKKWHKPNASHDENIKED